MTLMKKIILILLACFLIISCNGPNDVKPDLESGKVGMSVSFEGVPEYVYEGDTIDFNLVFKNLGKYDITDGQILISAYEVNYIPNGFNKDSSITSSDKISLQNSKGTFSVVGKSETHLKGGEEEVAISGFVDGLTGDIYQPPIKVEACYTYKTTAIANVCFDNGYSKNKEKSKECDYSTVKFNSNGQGGPIGLTNVKVQPRKDKSLIEFQVSHFGKGIIFNPGLVSECFSKIGLVDRNYIKVESVEVNGKSIIDDCVNLDENSMFRLDKEPPIFACTYTHEDVEGAYPEPVSVTFSYGHLITDDSSVVIKKV
jgi:hypothetical protein